VATAPLIDREELLVWLRGTGNAPADDDMEANDFLDVVIAGAEIVVRSAGLETWALPDAPGRARLIATLMARDYFANPDRNISETTGPISERRVDDVVRGMNLSEAERAELALLAGNAPPVAENGAGRLWVLGGTDQRAQPQKDIFVPAGQLPSDWLFPLYAADEPVIQNWPTVGGSHG
jgi:hypothetical protein